MVHAMSNEAICNRYFIDMHDQYFEKAGTPIYIILYIILYTLNGSKLGCTIAKQYVQTALAIYIDTACYASIEGFLLVTA